MKTKARIILQGFAANQQSRTEGFAFIAHTPSSARDQILAFKDKNPHILVCPQLDWSWSDVANLVAGVVADHGTRVSRGSEVSGIVQVPAVLGTKIATQQIKEGDYIEIVCQGTDAIAKVYSKTKDDLIHSENLE
jgi:phosphohistidine swiveling domain-containing protein